jgi:hypothetical protein
MSDSEMDLSSFMAVLIMTIGCLVILLVCNVVVIISNPENLSITSIAPRAYDSMDDPELARVMGEPLFSNKSKEPSYIDVHPDKIIIYPGQAVVPVSELEQPGNAFEQLLNDIYEKRDKEYIVLALRPRTSRISKRLEDAITDRGIDVGQDFFEKGHELNYKKVKSDSDG